MERTAGLTGTEREKVFLAEVLSGIPAFLRRLVPVELAGTTPSDEAIRGRAWVMADYLSIGSDSDYVRLPVHRDTALAIAREFELALPTCRIVDAVYEQSATLLDPLPKRPGPEMHSNHYYLAHSRSIDEQLGNVTARGLTAGHKKDLVLTRRLAEKTGRVAIYGWHRRNGRPIQPLSTVHGAPYADYSHGLGTVKLAVLERDLGRIAAEV